MRKNVKKNRHSPRFAAALANVDQDRNYSLEEAISLVKSNASAKFVESVDFAVRLGIDPRKSDQNVRGITNLPHGTGRTKSVAVLAKGDMVKEAEEAGADVVGSDDLITRILANPKEFEVIIAAEDMAPQIGKIGRALGPRTPNKRNGTVTNNVAAAVKEIKAATRVEYRAEKAGNVHLQVGKVNFTDEQIAENVRVAYDALIKAKPASAKGKFVLSVTLSSSMGPAIRVDGASIPSR